MNLIALSFLIPSTIAVLYIIAMCVRFEHLRSDIKAESIKLNCAIKFRITLLILDVVAQFCQFSLVFLCKQCYEYSEYISSILFINTSALIMQIFLMIYEFKKRVPSFFAHKIYWMINWVILFMIFALIISYADNLIDFILISFRIVILTILLIYTLFIRRQDIVEFEDLGFFNSEIPDVDVSDSQRPRISTINSINWIQLDNQSSGTLSGIRFRLNQICKVVIIFQSSIIEGERNFKLKKTVNEVLQLHSVLEQENQEYFENNPNEFQQLKYLISQIAESEDLLLINNVQKYFNIVMGRLELFSEALVNFIQLPQQERELLDDLKQQCKLHKSSIHKKCEPKLSKKWDVLAQYLPYLNITITEHQNIRQSNDNHVQYTMVTQFCAQIIMVQKRFREFYDFNEQLRQAGVRNLPPFPQKSVIRLTESEIEERQKDLEIFVKIVVNDRQNHNHQFIFQFIGLNQRQEELILTKKQQVIKVSEAIQGIQIKCSGFEEALDIDKYYRYSFQLLFNNVKQHIITKRYRQFDELHSVLKHRYSSLPSIPSKAAAIQQVNPNTRSAQLASYLLELIKVPFIGENPHLVQFLELTNFWSGDQGNEGSFTQFQNMMERIDNDSVLIQLDAMRDRLWE